MLFIYLIIYVCKTIIKLTFKTRVVGLRHGSITRNICVNPVLGFLFSLQVHRELQINSYHEECHILIVHFFQYLMPKHHTLIKNLNIKSGTIN